MFVRLEIAKSLAWIALLTAPLILCSCDSGGATSPALTNLPPSANAGSDQNVSEGDLVILDAGQSRDADSAITSYLWSQLSGPEVQLSSPSSALTRFTAPEVSTETTLTFRVTVTSADGGRAQDEINIVASGMETRVLTDQGFYEGERTQTVTAFKGMAFAQPPVADLRWAAPQPAAEFDGVRTAGALGAACWQADQASFTGFRAADNISEDCLYLNVWTPGTGTDTPRPVMLWIHGGSNTGGSSANPIYDGEALAADQDVVVVSINYRLGVFGYLAHPGLSLESASNASGNYGLQDILMALQWTRDNIASFGGDPGNVTVFGQSAGALNICALLTSSLQNGLFDKAIMQSGACPMALRDLKTDGTDTRADGADGGLLSGPTGTQSAEGLGLETERELGCHTAPEALECMRSVSPQVIYETLTINQFQPIVDGYVLSEAPGLLFASGQQSSTPLLIGSTENEMGVLRQLNIALIPSVTAYERRLERRFGSDADLVQSFYPANTDEEALAAYEELTTDIAFTCSARRAALDMALSTTAPVWVYLFSALTPGFEDRGAFHGSEIPFVFGNLDVASYTSADKALSASMRSYWGNFARTGNPNGSGQTVWQQFFTGLEDHLNLNHTIDTGFLLKQDECELLDSLLYP